MNAYDGFIFCRVTFINNAPAILCIIQHHSQLTKADHFEPRIRPWTTWIPIPRRWDRKDVGVNREHKMWYVFFVCLCVFTYIYIYIWVNYNISLTWIKAIWEWFPLLTMIPVRSQWGRYNLPRYIHTYMYIYILHTYIHSYKYIISCIYIHRHTYVYIYMYIYIYIR